MSKRPDKAAAPIRRGGRPTRADAERLRQTIIDAATEMIFDHGYGATSIDAIALKARISKRTFYSRFRDKAELFGAVVHDVIARLQPPGGAGPNPFAGADVEQVLLRLARMILRAALKPEAIALNRVVVAEAQRFPELAAVVAEQGGRRQAVEHIAALLQREKDAGRLAVANPAFAAEQFLQMTVALPQRRAMGLGDPMSEAELDAWARDTVRLFLDGCCIKPK